MFILPQDGCRDPAWRRLISIKVIAEAIVSVDPWRRDFIPALREALLKNADGIYAAMGELFPELPEEVVSKWVFEAARDVPEEQAFWRMIVKKCSPSTNLNYMDGREGSRAREAMGLLKVMRGTAQRLSRLPDAIAAENPEHALEVAVAEFLRCGSRRAFNLVKTFATVAG